MSYPTTTSKTVIAIIAKIKQNTREIESKIDFMQSPIYLKNRGAYSLEEEQQNIVELSRHINISIILASMIVKNIK